MVKISDLRIILGAHNFEMLYVKHKETVILNPDLDMKLIPGDLVVVAKGVRKDDETDKSFEKKIRFL